MKAWTLSLIMVAAAFVFSACVDRPGWPHGSTSPHWGPTGRSEGRKVSEDILEAVSAVESGILVRCDLVGIARPTWQDEFRVPAGESNEVVLVPGPTGSVWTVTDRIPLTKNVYMTNATAPFDYTVTNDAGQVFTGTITPPDMTPARWAAFESKLDALIPYFVSTNATNFALFYDATTNYPAETKAGLLARNQIGMTAALTTNRLGWITGGAAAWRVMDPDFGKTPNQVILGETVTDLEIGIAGFPADGADGVYSRKKIYTFLFDWTEWQNDAGASIWPVESGWILSAPGGYYELDQWSPAATNAWTEYFTGMVITGGVSTVRAGWTFRAVDSFARIPGGNDPYDIRIHLFHGPSSILYEKQTNVTAQTITATVYGNAFTNAATNAFYWFDLPPETNETVTITATGRTELAFQWVNVTDIVASNADPYLGESLTVVGNGVRLGRVALKGRVFMEMLAERKKALNALKWVRWGGTRSWGDLSIGTGQGTTNNPNYTSNWWEGVKSQAAANWGTTNVGNPTLYGYGLKDSYGYAIAQQYEASVVFSNVPTLFPRTGELYAKFAPYSGTNYFNPDFNVAPTTTALIFTYPLGAATNLVSDIFGMDDAPATDDPIWPDEPQTFGTPVLKGYSWGNVFLILKYEIPDL
jgi:hypothetical protein